MKAADGPKAHGGGYWNEAPEGEARFGEIEVAVRGLAPLRLTTVSHSFSPGRLDPGSALLLEAVLAAYAAPDAAPPERIADLGGGCGVLGLSLARRFPDARVDLIELNARAAAVAVQNAERLSLTNAHVHAGDVSAVWPTLPRHDLVVTNPPIRAGRSVYGPWLEASRERLAPGGTFWFVARTAQGAASLQAILARHLERVDVADRKSGYRVIRGQAPPPTA